MKKRELTGLVEMCLFTALIAAGAFIRIPIPVCPFTLQFLFTNMAGIMLGAKRGAASTAVYVVLGLIGLPVFANGGGLGYVLEPTFGYLLGFIAGAYITGKVTESGSLTFGRVLVGSFSGLTAVYLFGMAYYWLISALWLGSPIGLWELFLYCFVLAVPGDIILCFASAAIAVRVVPVIRNRGII